MTDYSKMTKDELIDWVQGLDSRIDNQRGTIEVLQSENTGLIISRDYYRDRRDAILKEYGEGRQMPSGWWIGVALFAAILIPWVLFGIWVMS